MIRSERPTDIAAIRAVNAAAFESSAEADLVERLRAQATPFVSLLADDGASIVGHVCFSPVTLSGDADLKIIGLAPMAVVPAAQRRGIGSALVLDGIERCRSLGYGAIVVLGHADYYPRFGFVPASRFGIRSNYDVPDDVFLLLELQRGYLAGKTGTIHYHPAFAGV